MSKRDVVFRPDAKRFMSAIAIRRQFGPMAFIRSGQVGSTEDGSPEPDLETRFGSRSTI